MMNFGEIIKVVANDIFVCFYSYGIQSLVFSLLMVSMMMLFRHHEKKIGIIKLISELKTKRQYRYYLIFFFYIYVLAMRTLLGRERICGGLDTVMNEWWFYFDADKLNCNFLENIILFIPYPYLMFLTFRNLVTGKIGWKIIMLGLMLSFGTSMFIELNQLIFKLGTLQLADLVYNTLGGFIGCLFFIRNKKER